jgi:gas vesicle protein
MGYIRGLIHGAAIGTIVGICIAPQDGKRTREQLQRSATAVQQGARKAQMTARRMGPTMQSAAQSVGEVVDSVRGMVSRQHDEEETFVSVNGNGNPTY